MTQEIETFESQKNAHMYTLAIPWLICILTECY